MCFLDELILTANDTMVSELEYISCEINHYGCGDRNILGYDPLSHVKYF